MKHHVLWMPDLHAMHRPSLFESNTHALHFLQQHQGIGHQSDIVSTESYLPNHGQERAEGFKQEQESICQHNRGF